MRFRFKPSAEQRAALKARLVRLQHPETVVPIVRPILPDGFEPEGATCTVAFAHSDRAVVRVELRGTGGARRTYALKVFSDEFPGRIWEYSRAVAAHCPPNHDGLSLPSGYLPEERALVFPWVEGEFLSEIVDRRKPELLRQAARLAARLHRARFVPEEPTSAATIVEDTLARCDRLRRRWPAAATLVDPLIAPLREALGRLDPAAPAPIHGDCAAGQFLWTGERLLLLDLDMFGYADPAYDVGHFLGQLERRGALDAALPPDAVVWMESFLDAYLAEMPAVSRRNVTFYRGVTLLRKVYTLCRKHPAEWPALAPVLAERAGRAFAEVRSGGGPH